MNDTYHLVAGGLVALAALAFGASRGALKRLNRKQTGYEPTLIRVAALGPVVGTLAGAAAVAIEIAVRAFQS